MGQPMIVPLDTLLAIKTINLADGLRPSDRRIAVALIEHFNRRTGRCDPGIERLSKLTNYSIRTVLRSTAHLQTLGLIGKVRHGGHANRNRYEPNWQKIAELGAKWEERLRAGSRSRSAKLSPATGQPRPLDGDSGVTQTYRDNLIKRTCQTALEGNRMARAGRRDPSIPSSTAWRSAAERRVSQEIDRRFASDIAAYAQVIGAIDSSLMNAATEAEMKQRGSGIHLIIEHLRIPNAT
jgi:hypothetical protein